MMTAARMRLNRILRETERLTPILEPLKPYDAAERILGDLVGYRKYYRGSEVHMNYTDDIERLAGALLAIAALSVKTTALPSLGYTIAADGTSITCIRCDLTSHHPSDIEQRYCGYCRVFHDQELGG